MCISGRLDRHAIAGKHVEVRCGRKGFDRGPHRQKRCFDETPFSPATADPVLCKCHAGVANKSVVDAPEILGSGARIEMNRYVVTGFGQTICLRDDPFRILVAQQNEGYFGHCRGLSRVLKDNSHLIASHSARRDC